MLVGEGVIVLLVSEICAGYTFFVKVYYVVLRQVLNGH